jgi:hypothetical protein
VSTLAKDDFDTTMQSVRALNNLDAAHRDPPAPGEIPTAEGLRAGAIVLMVGGFERYLKAVVEELLNSISHAEPPCRIEKLPSLLRAEATYRSLEIAMKGLPWESTRTREQRLPDVLAAAERIANKEISGHEVAQTAGNPKSDQVKSICKVLDYAAVFSNIEASFTRRWGSPVAKTFVRDQLDIIVERRHSVAHTASILTTSRGDIVTWTRFMQSLVDTFDDALKRHVGRIIARAQ